MSGPARRLRTLGLAAAIAGGCTPTLDFEQCRGDRDCTNEVGLDLVCVEQECVLRPTLDDFTCEQTRDCHETFGEQVWCGPDRRCLPLRADGCVPLAFPGGVAPDALVWLGSILASEASESGVRLAYEDFITHVDLPGGHAMGWLACDGATSPGLAASHLGEVGVPATIGPSTSQAVTTVSERVDAVEMLLLTPEASGGATPSPDRLVRLVADDELLAQALADHVASLGTGAPRVLLFAAEDPVGVTMARAVRTALAASLEASAVATLLVPSPEHVEDPDARQAQYAAAVDQGLVHGADVVLALGGAASVDLGELYLRGAIEADPSSLPRLVFAREDVSALPELVLAFAPELRPTLMPQVEAISSPPPPEDRFAAFDARYQARFGAPAQPASARAYDAALLAMLSYHAVLMRDAPLEGRAVAEALTRLDTGPSFAWSSDPSILAEAAATLRTTGEIDVEGVSGALDLDGATGALVTSLVGWTLVPREGTNTVPVLTPARTWSLASGEWRAR